MHKSMTVPDEPGICLYSFASVGVPANQGPARAPSEGIIFEAHAQAILAFDFRQHPSPIPAVAPSISIRLDLLRAISVLIVDVARAFRILNAAAIPIASIYLFGSTEDVTRRI